MSLASFLRMIDVKAKLKPLRPKLPRKIAAPLKVEPRSNRYPMVGTAFDYLLRFEIQRRAPYAVAERWVAESAPGKIWRQDDQGGVSFSHLSKDDNGIISIAIGPNAGLDAEELAKEVAGQMGAVVAKAKSAFAAYLKNTSPDRPQQADLAAHAIRLAKLDEMYRASQLDSSFESADPEDVEDLLDLLAIVPFKMLLHDKVLLLNPTFKQSSKVVGEADTDLITGNMLVDFKTTKAGEMTADSLDQLLGYYLLARHQRRVDATFPAINRLALYFSRHGYLWAASVTAWTNNPQFSEVEEWFFKRAKEALALLES